MPPNSPVGQVTVNTDALKPPPAIACAPSPYPLRNTMVKNGTVILAPVTNILAAWRTSAVFSISGPTMMPGVSHKLRMGISKASQSCKNLAALSAPSLSIAPERNSGLLAMMPIGRPSILARAVIMPRPKCARSSSTESVSANKLMTSRIS